jgi:hypothetical protein
MLFEPQHFADPSAMTAHVKVKPALTLTAVVDAVSPSIPETYTKFELLVVVPLPNCPAALKPQHDTAPLAMTAHV